MGLHSSRILGLGQDLEQLIVRQEVEPGERSSLRLQVLAETLLDLFQELVALPEVLQEASIRAEGDDVGVVGSHRHHLPPHSIHCLVPLALDWQLPEMIAVTGRSPLHTINEFTEK